MTGGGFFAGQQRSRACAEVFADSRGECWAAFPAHPEPGGNCAAAPSAALRAIRALPSCARGVRGETGYGGSAKGFWLPLHLQVRGGRGGSCPGSFETPRLLLCRVRAKPVRGQRWSTSHPWKRAPGEQEEGWKFIPTQLYGAWDRSL